MSADLRTYGGGIARRDLQAGLTVAALALPSAMAYAELAGLSPITGLYALLLPTLAYVLLGSSRQVIVGPEGSISALVAAAVLPLAVAGSAEAAEAAAMLALLVAAFFGIAWLLKLDWIADYFSQPVLVGYLHGVAVVLILGQVDKLLGVSVESEGPLREAGSALLEVSEASGLTVLVGLAALAILILARFIAPRFPVALVVVIGAIVVSWAANLEDHGVAVVGSIPAGLPTISVPSPPLTDVFELIAPAFGIFLVCFADEILTARSFAGRRRQHVRSRQELLAMGAASAGAGVTGAFPIGASGSRTAVNDSVGGRTQVAAFFAGATVLVVLLFLTEPISYLPSSVLAAVIVSAALGLVDPGAWRTLWGTDRVEVAIAAVTMAGVVAVGVLEALLFAVGLSVIDVVRRSANPHDAVLGWVERLGRYADVAVHRDAVTTPGVVVYRLDDRLFFANADYFRARIREAIRGAGSPLSVVVVDGEGITHVDASGLDALSQVRAELGEDGVRLVFARFKEPVVEDLMNPESPAGITAGDVFPTVRAAVEACAAATSQSG